MCKVYLYEGVIGTCGLSRVFIYKVFISIGIS
jgi:hypothetical protein